MPLPLGDNAVKYREVRMLTIAYAKELAEGDMSYADLLRRIDRLTELGKEARRLWGDQ